MVYGVVEAAPVMVTVQVNPPAPDTVAPQEPIVAPLLMVVVTVTPGVKPVPVTVTETPLGPWVFERVTLELVTVNVAVPASKEPSEPVAVTVYAAGVLELIVTMQLNVPVPDTVAPQLVIVAPELIEAVIVTPGVNPVPEIVTAVPLEPLGGVSVTDGIVTSNDAVAASKLPSEPVAETV